MFNTRLCRVNFDEASVQGLGISILRGEENIPIDSDTVALMPATAIQGVLHGINHLITPA